MTANLSDIAEVQLVIMGPRGRVDLTHVTGFECRQITRAVRVNRIDGVTLSADLPCGWEGGFTLDEHSRALFDDLEPATIGTMYQYVAELDGGISTYQFDGVIFSGCQNGARIGFSATRRRRI